jgi:hypothetical protein
MRAALFPIPALTRQHAPCAHADERSAIERWLASHDTSPKTNARLEHKQLIPNHSLRGSIEQFQESRRRR